MALPTTPDSWIEQFDLPNRLFERSPDDYELYEEDGEFVLSVEMPGFDTDEISAAWDDGVLNITAERTDDDRGHRKTYHRSFRFPKRVVEAEIDAEYANGVLEVRLPIEGTAVSGREIEIQ